MTLKIKFFILFLIVSVVPLAGAGLLTFNEASKEISGRIVTQLTTLADVQHRRVNEIVERYLEQTKTAAADTQVRTLLLDGEGDADVLTGLRDAITLVESISVLTLEGDVVGSTDHVHQGKNDAQAAYFASAQRAPTLHDVFRDERNTLKVRLVAPVMNDHEIIGSVVIVASAAPLISVTEDYSGLGDTGEVLLAKRNSAGDAVFLTPLRFDAGAALNRAIPQEEIHVPMVPAVQGENRVFTDDTTIDYRGEKIFAVTRFISALNWGLVAKIDRDEALAPVRALGEGYMLIILISVFLVTVVSLVLVRSITDPIKRLTMFAQNLENENFSMRTQVRGKDEISFLAQTFNSMAEKLQDIYERLEDRIRERTRQLQRVVAKDEAMLEGLGEGLIATDEKGRITLANPAFEKMLGWKKTEVIGKRLVDLVEMQDANKKRVTEVNRTITKVLKDKKVYSTPQGYYYSRKDGTMLPVATTVAPIILDDVVVGAVEVFRDITKEYEIDRAKTEFVSLASHQLRTPLSTVNWYAEMLLDGDAGKLTKQQVEFLKEIQIGNQRMTALVNALLNVSRIELGSLQIDPEPVDVSALAQSVLDEQRPQINERNLNVKPVLPGELPKLYADPKLLRMVFQNLLSNAVKYTHANGTIRYEVALDRKNILITVADTGMGIPKHQQEKVFDKLFRADNVKVLDTQGTGLGLYIIKSIVEQSGGAIRFESEEDKGTTFYITLPLAGIKKKAGTKTLS